MRPIERIVVHHSASSRETTLEQIDSWHRARGWDGVGYHLVVLGDGHIVQGRDLEKKGAHAKGYNQRSIGVCVVGDNTDPGNEWSFPQKVALRALLDLLRILYPTAEVMGHRDLPGAATACPGVDIRSIVRRGVT